MVSTRIHPYHHQPSQSKESDHYSPTHLSYPFLLVPLSVSLTIILLFLCFFSHIFKCRQNHNMSCFLFMFGFGKTKLSLISTSILYISISVLSFSLLYRISLNAYQNSLHLLLDFHITYYYGYSDDVSRTSYWQGIHYIMHFKQIYIQEFKHLLFI